MKKIYLLLIWVFCSVLVSCTHPKNDCELYFSGQYVVEENGAWVPFRQRIRCGITFTMHSQVSYGVSSYKPTYILFSNDDGSFEYSFKGTGSNRARLNSSVCVGDTLVYYCDTSLVCPHSTPQKDIQIPLKCRHYFAPTITPSHFCFDDTLTFSINHDALTYIELCYRGEDSDGLPGDIPVWSSSVNKVQSYSFIFPEELKEKGTFFVKYTTLHYGTYRCIYQTPSQRGCD